MQHAPRCGVFLMHFSIGFSKTPPAKMHEIHCFYKTGGVTPLLRYQQRFRTFHITKEEFSLNMREEIGGVA